MLLHSFSVYATLVMSNNNNNNNKFINNMKDLIIDEKFNNVETVESKESSLEDLREELAHTLYPVPVRYDEEFNVYYQVIESEDGEEKVEIEERFYPVVEHFIN
jgi:hypothetical protein